MRPTIKIVLAAFIGVTAVAFAEDAFKMSSLVVPAKEEQRNPTTEIAADFGDIAHLSPWRVKRRFPRSVENRGGQLVSLRDAMVAINEIVAKDEEMPEHSFELSNDGMLVAICDVPVAAKGGQAIGGRIDGAPVKDVTKELLDSPVREFEKVVFVKVKTGAAAAAPAAAEGTLRKTGDTKIVTLPGGATMEMIWCGPGTFMMGSPTSEVGRFDDEPIHPVTLTKGFWLGKYEVTQAQWASVMGSNNSRFKGPDRPMDNISWEDCKVFVSKVNATLGGLARFPTEAEWEYACRAGSDNPVSGSGSLDDMAWYDSNSGSQTHEIGKHSANAWGFYDMHGNVLEWCGDWFSKFVDKAVDPKGPPSGSFRVLRGGCWFFYARDCRSAYRLKRDPAIRNCVFGFRLACSEK